MDTLAPENKLNSKEEFQRLKRQENLIPQTRSEDTSRT